MQKLVDCLKILCYNNNIFRNTVLEKKRNRYHSATRTVIENTFGRLKGRWRMLKYVNVNSIKKIVLITTACCVLHNFTYLLNDCWTGVNEDDDEIQNERENRNVDNVTGAAKRNEITLSFQ